MILKQHQFHHHLNFQNISIKLNNSYDAHPFDKTQHLPPPFLNLDLPFDYDIPFFCLHYLSYWTSPPHTKYHHYHYFLSPLPSCFFSCLSSESLDLSTETIVSNLSSSLPYCRAFLTSLKRLRTKFNKTIA